jgi:FkbM family methyltransferase
MAVATFPARSHTALTAAMKSFLTRAAAKLAANRIAQRCLQDGVRTADYLMGIGTGCDVNTSGEASVLRRLRRADHRGELVIFDAGSNRGQFLRMCVELLPLHACDIHCFEPSKASYSVLCDVAGSVQGVTLNNFGLGKEVRDRPIFADTSGSGLASLTKRRLDHFNIDFSFSELVHIETLDGYCSQRNIDRIDLLKLDVEGHELDVLAGAAEMLQKNAIRNVTFEFGGCNIDTRTFVQDFYYLFSSRGMRIARITPGGYWAEIARYSEIYEQFRTTNFVAYSPSSALRR